MKKRKKGTRAVESFRKDPMAPGAADGIEWEQDKEAGPQLAERGIDPDGAHAV